jgi:hypothetical protein
MARSGLGYAQMRWRFGSPEIEPGLQQQHADPRILGEPRRQHRTCRPATDDDVIVLAVHDFTRTRSTQLGAVDHLARALTNESCDGQRP